MYSPVAEYHNPHTKRHERFQGEFSSRLVHTAGVIEVEVTFEPDFDVKDAKGVAIIITVGSSTEQPAKNVQQAFWVDAPALGAGKRYNFKTFATWNLESIQSTTSGMAEADDRLAIHAPGAQGQYMPLLNTLDSNILQKMHLSRRRTGCSTPALERTPAACPCEFFVQRVPTSSSAAILQGSLQIRQKRGGRHFVNLQQAEHTDAFDQVAGVAGVLAENSTTGMDRASGRKAWNGLCLRVPQCWYVPNVLD
jgi:hypothetical protein